MDPKVSIIIPFYNCSFVDQAIKSALQQTYTNIEIVLVDDGSTLFTEKVTEFLGDIRYVRKENGGTASALNRGIKEATGEYIAWLSSDDYLLPDKISKQISFMLTHKAMASFTNYDLIDDKNQVIYPWHCQRFSNNDEVYKTFLNYNTINGCTVILNKELVDLVGDFNPYFRYTHDYEMWYRILVNGYKIHYLDEVLTNFRIHELSGTNKHKEDMLKEITIIEGSYRHKLVEYLKKSGLLS